MGTRGGRGGFRAGILIAVTAAGAGCVQVEESRNPVSSSLAEIGATAAPELGSSSAELSRLQFDDIPVPEGFFLRNHRNETFSYVFSGNRVGRFVYWGLGDPKTVRRHFQQNMGKEPYGWTLAESTSGSAEDRLTFEKPGHICTVSWAPTTPPKRGELLLTITVESI